MRTELHSLHEDIGQPIQTRQKRLTEPNYTMNYVRNVRNVLGVTPESRVKFVHSKRISLSPR